MSTNDQVTQNASIRDVLLGQTMEVSCGVQEEGSGVTKRTLTCPGVTTLRESSDVLAVFEVTKDLHESTCMCQLEGCYSEMAHFTFHVACKFLQ